MSATKRMQEYREGSAATDAFEQGMKALFQVPKEASGEKLFKSKQKARKKRAKRSTADAPLPAILKRTCKPS